MDKISKLAIFAVSIACVINSFNISCLHREIENLAKTAVTVSTAPSTHGK